ncbi:MAG: L,D-transpeptidase family protein, partial [Bacteroidales bacterium]|nr:L,D-transpeptidase family protein [Bacteroidales bacterium]
SVLHNISREGLNPEDYNLSAIEKLTDEIILSEEAEPGDIKRLETLLTDAFLLLSTHLALGKTDAVTIDPQWKASRRTLTMDLASFTDSTLLNNLIIENLQKLTPAHREYSNLKKALAEYHLIEEKGGWAGFSTILPKLEMGMCEPDIALLRNRLAITQVYIENDTINKNLFDQSLYMQVMLFQLRNGLTADGVVGKATVEAMNISVEERIATIEANLERWRWLSNDLGERYIKVNIANFDLQVLEKDITVFSTEAIVGLTNRKTPVFSSVMKYLVLNPDWTVPPTILNDDVIPSVIENPGYLAKKNLKILRIDGTEVDPFSIDWINIVATGFPYRVHQAPGPGNALGLVKFIFPNIYSVYIHDTPNRNLFGRTDRLFSSGCIRVNHPMDLVAWLMKDNPDWTPAQIKNVVDQGKEQIVNLVTPIQVHILYLTAWAGDDGLVYFRRDIYDRDQPLLVALRKGPHGPDQ